MNQILSLVTPLLLSMSIVANQLYENGNVLVNEKNVFSTLYSPLSKLKQEAKITYSHLANVFIYINTVSMCSR